MSQVKLSLVRGLHNPSLSAGYRVTATRIVAIVNFTVQQGPTAYETIALVDTGAPLSLIPKSVWRNIRYEMLAPLMVGGLADKPGRRFAADLALIECAVSDGNSTIGPFRIHALLAKNDNVPSLLGLSGVLEQVDLSVSLRDNTAHLEMP